MSLSVDVAFSHNHSSETVQPLRNFGVFSDGVCKDILAIAGPEVASELRASKDAIFW